MEVKLTPVKVFDVAGRDGRLERLRQVGDEWNHMIELRDERGAKLVLMRSGGPLAQAISEIVGSGSSDWIVVSGSPSLLATLGLPRPGSEQGPAT